MRGRDWRGTLEERFWRSVYKTQNCWFWVAGVNVRGYGRLRNRNGKVDSAHRISLQLTGVEIPPEKQVLHHCDTPQCVNPEHLFIGTIKDNSDDCAAKGHQGLKEMLKTECPKGHPYDEKNTYYYKNGARQCRTCGAECARRYRREKRLT